MRNSEMNRAREKALDGLKKEWEAAHTLADRSPKDPKKQAKAAAKKAGYLGLKAYHEKEIALQDLEEEVDDDEDQGALPWE